MEQDVIYVYMYLPWEAGGAAAGEQGGEEKGEG